MNYHGIGVARVVGVLSDAQALPNATSEYSTNMVDIKGKTGGKLMLAVYANTAVEIITTAAFNIELLGYTVDVEGSATAPFSSAGALEPAHFYPLHKTSADGEIAWLAGELITEIPVPENLLELMEYDFINLAYTASADESANLVDAFLYWQ